MPLPPRSRSGVGVGLSRDIVTRLKRLGAGVVSFKSTESVLSSRRLSRRKKIF